MSSSIYHSMRRSSPAVSPTSVAYPSPHRSPSMGMGKVSMVSSDSRWSTEQIPTSGPYEHQSANSWVSTSYSQPKPHSPIHHHHHHHSPHQDSYNCLPSPPHQNYGMEGDMVPTSMPLEPSRHLLSPPTSEVLLSNEHTSAPSAHSSSSGMWNMSQKVDMTGMGMSLEVSEASSTMSSPLLSMSEYAGDMNMSGMGMDGEDSDSLRRWRSASDPNAGYDPRKPRRKRQLTGPDEANFRCEVCGKFFSRIWNYNAHKSTHDPNRLKPHLCTLDNCHKSFVRKTDLNRHQACVHQKIKKFECSLCHNKFARKDTLRRHEDDGCPKRVDIVSRNNKAKPISISSLQFPSSSGYYQREERPIHTDYRAHSYDHSMQSSYLPPILNKLL